MSKRNSWSSNKGKQHHPAGLKGAQIGMFYRNLHKQRTANNTSDVPKAPKIHCVKLTIPSPILETVSEQLKALSQLAKEENINIPKTSVSFEIQKNKGIHTQSYSIDELESDSFSNFKTPVHPVRSPSLKRKSDSNSDTSEAVLNCQPGSSKMADFIPVPDNTLTSFEMRPQSLTDKVGGDFKYGYEDIITGSFSDKLNECLIKGASICSKSPEVTDLSNHMLNEYNEMLNNDKYKKMLIFRQNLPAYKKRQELMEVINNNQVTVISGETGCGKSTQVPQLILDQALSEGNGANTKVFVTQPRRIAASSLAMRIAEERGERMGNTVGYAVRLEKVDARARGSIMFCTTGILLTDLEVNQGLVNYSHVILDEVHERDTNIDLTMCMLKQVLKKRSDLKLILMSATIDADRLSKYFDDCPMIHIEGLAYPVKDYYLEDILMLTKYELPPPPPTRKPKVPMHGNRNRRNQMMDEINAREMQNNIRYRADICHWLEHKRKDLDFFTYKMLQEQRIENLNIDLILELLIKLCKKEPGAILIFLPGIGEISKLIKSMEESQQFPKSCFDVYPLHSKLPTLDQHVIFERPPLNKRKIIIATNIAETSITIDDIVYVIDCGMCKITGLDIDKNYSTLKTEFISKANLRQRRGRAGRCQPGVCYHLVSSYRAEKLEDRTLPELQRSNLLDAVLIIKRLRLGKAEEAFKLLLDPPAIATIRWAVKNLTECGALDDNEVLTPLGWHMARLPVPPAAGKLLLLGSLFGCLDRAASIAAVWGFKDPFLLVIGKEHEIDDIKGQLTLGEPSDHVAISESILQYEQLHPSQRGSYTYRHFLSRSILDLLIEMKGQLYENLKLMGFSSGKRNSNWENRNADNLSLFKAVVAAALYPNVASVKWLNLFKKNSNRRTRIKVHTEQGVTTIHPSSVMAGGMKYCTNSGANWLVYWKQQKSSDLFLIEVTLVYTLPLLFFGSMRIKEAEKPDECMISISSVHVRCLKSTAELLLSLRSYLDYVLASKVTNDKNNLSANHSKFEESVLNAVMDLITAEDEKADYLGDDSFSDSDRSEYETNRYKY